MRARDYALAPRNMAETRRIQLPDWDMESRGHVAILALVHDQPFEDNDMKR